MEALATVKGIGEDAEMFGHATDNEEIAHMGIGLRRTSNNITDRKLSGDMPYLISTLMGGVSRLNSTVARAVVDKRMQPGKSRLLKKIAVTLDKLDTMHRSEMKNRQMRARTRRRMHDMGNKMIKKCIDIGGAKAW